METKEFINKYYDSAIKAASVDNWNPLIILTVAAHESDMGESCPRNMFFGAKIPKGWTGKKQLLRTWEELDHPNGKFPEIISVTKKVENGKEKYVYRIRDWFKAFDTPEESFIDYTNIIKTRKRYSKAFESRKDPFEYFVQIKLAGYATDAKYTLKLKAMYNKLKTEIDNNLLIKQ